MGKKISIAIATFNGELYLREQLDSLYNQTHVPEEIVVVDDCSIDRTREILEDYHQKYGLIYVINESQLGINKNFEKAILLCSGDYIALCDQDDVWMPHKVETSLKMLQKIEHNQPALISSRAIQVDAGLNKIVDPPIAQDTDKYFVTLFGHDSQGCSLMMNRALLNYIIPLPSDQNVMFDIYIGIIASMVGNKYNISEALMYYRRHSSNVCGRASNKKYSYTFRIKNRFRDRYPLFIPEDKFYCMKEIALQKSNFFIEERKNLYYKILSLDRNKSILKNIKVIFSFKELSYKKRFIAVGNTIISFLLRNLRKAFK